MTDTPAAQGHAPSQSISARWFLGLTENEKAAFTADGLSEFDLANLDALIAGQGDWFHAKLVRLFHKASPLNWRRLFVSFPGTGAALHSWGTFDE